MKISLASDHGGFLLKEKIKDYLNAQGHRVFDFGTHTTDSCDYPMYARNAAMAVKDGRVDRGIVVCTTGMGVSMVANKVRGVRCALCLSVDMAEMTRHHNDANVLALGQKYVDEQTALQIVDAFLTTPFDGGRHQTRVDKIEE